MTLNSPATSEILAQISPRHSPYTRRYEEFFARIRDKILALAFFDSETVKTLQKYKLSNTDDYDFSLNFYITFHRSLIDHNLKLFTELGAGFIQDVSKDSPEYRVSVEAFQTLVAQRNHDIAQVVHTSKLALSHFRIETYSHLS